MATARWIKTSDGIERYIGAFLERGKTIQAYLNRVAYPQYQQAQVGRWQSENASETGQWAALNPKYAVRKIKEFAEFPGGGRALMVATGKLSQAAMGRGDGALKVISGNTMTVGVEDSVIPYGRWAAGLRPIMEFGQDTTDLILTGVADWLMKGE